MTRSLERFKSLILDELLPEFCDDASRSYGRDGFNENSIQISERDASDFLRAFDANLIVHHERGLYGASRSQIWEQFFWEGLKSKTPRPVTLWIEPIITVAVLARLHFDFKWPKDLIGTQSKDWAFDAVAFLPGNNNEHIACEVKKTVSELDRMIELMMKYAADTSIDPATMTKTQRNAYNKVSGLKTRHAPIFWAVGPDMASHVFRVSYENGGVAFESATPEVLHYSQ